GQAIALNLGLSVNSFTGPNGDGPHTNSLNSVVVSNIPVGATLSDGHGNSFTATGSHTSVDVATWNLATLTIKSSDDGIFTLHIAATEKDAEGDVSATTGANLMVTVLEQADPPNLAVASHTLSGNAGTAVALNISASAAELDQNAPSITITGLGNSTLTNANHDTLTIANGSITLTAAQLTGLTLHGGSDGLLNLTITATDTEANSSAQSQTSIAVTV